MAALYHSTTFNDTFSSHYISPISMWTAENVCVTYGVEDFRNTESEEYCSNINVRIFVSRRCIFIHRLRENDLKSCTESLITKASIVAFNIKKNRRAIFFPRFSSLLFRTAKEWKYVCATDKTITRNPIISRDILHLVKVALVKWNMLELPLKSTSTHIILGEKNEARCWKERSQLGWRPLAAGGRRVAGAWRRQSAGSSPNEKSLSWCAQVRWGERGQGMG